MKRALLAAVLLGVAGPSWADKKPDWVDGPSGRYPRERYLVGVGIGDDRATSEDRARGEISKIFSTQVSVKTDLTESEANLKDGSGEKSSFSQSISQNVQTVSKKVLEGVELVENWRDPTAAQHYALAVLEKSKAIRVIEDKLDEIDKLAGEWKGSLESSTEKLPRVKAAMKLLAVLKARDGLNSDLRVLAGGAGRALSFNEGEIRQQAGKALAELDVVVDMSGGRSDQVETGIVKGLGGFGIQSKAGGPADPSDIFVEGKVETKPMEGDGTPWKWARSNVTLSLKDGRTAKTFLQFDASDRQASKDYNEAVRRSHSALSLKIADQVRDAITAYFENQ